MFELTLQRLVEGSGILIQATSITYWLSQFAVVGIALLYVYFKAHDRFAGFRNTLIVGNLIGLAGYVLLPTAPPRMFPEAGFTDTLAAHSTVNHSSTFVAFSSNPYAAMPSLHALDALIVSVVMATVVRRRWAKVLWLAWAPWVWFAVMATGNHFWLDIAAGILVAGDRGGDRLPPLAPPAPARRGMSLKDGVHRRRAGGRGPLDDGARPHARDAEHAHGGGRDALRGRRRARLLRVPPRAALLLARRARVRRRLGA